MNRLIYRVMYMLTHPGWDTGKTPPELIEAFTRDKIPPGPVLDLGCGTGTNVIYMAQHGRTAIGIDFVPEAIARGRKKAAQAGVGDLTQFLVADVTRLDKLGLPTCSFALDMGCFHGLTRSQQHQYVEGLSAHLLPGGLYMLYALDPNREAGITFGISLPEVQDAFAPRFEILRAERDNTGRRGSMWYWMRRLG